MVQPHTQQEILASLGASEAAQMQHALAGVGLAKIIDAENGAAELAEMRGMMAKTLATHGHGACRAHIVTSRILRKRRQWRSWIVAQYSTPSRVH